ncbi:MAG: lamin tail domain-containing protein, partial [Bacteroidaceae bacterium]|nr:lamin tail domain-containing protein [Bacteroidaceae bacterium]
YVNDYFKKNDWIELYNTTGKDIDIRGMYISDNEEKPLKYQVPSDDVLLNTVIPAHSYKVIWCDKLDNIGADIHTTFKLAAEGGSVLITTEEYADTLQYPTHLGIQSFGRYPDGGNDTYVMNIPTIGKTNQIGSYDTLYVAPVEEEPELPNSIRSYTKEGGITIAYVDGVVNVKSEDAAITRLGLFNAAGMKMGTAQTTRASSHFASIYVATLPKGIYIVSATTESGDECHIKFAIK